VTRFYPIFNLADSAIVCGGILTVILAMRGQHLDGTRGDAAPAPAAVPSAPADESEQSDQSTPSPTDAER